MNPNGEGEKQEYGGTLRRRFGGPGTLDHARSPTVSAISTAADHPRTLSHRGNTSPAILLPETTSIIAAIIGTDTMPLMTAAQINMRMGSMLVVARPAPPRVAAPHNPIETKRATGRQLEAAAQTESFGHRIGCRCGKNWHCQ